MPGRVKAVVLLSLFVVLSFNAVADCSQWTATSSNAFRTTALDLSVDGNFLWVATGYGAQLLEYGEVVDSIGLPGTTRTVRALGNGIAYAGSGSSVYVLRRDGRSITTLTSIGIGGTVNDLEVVGAALFAAADGGIAHFDIFNPAAPVRTNVVLPVTTPFVTSLATAKSKLYAADGDDTVEVYSMAIPLLPQHIGQLKASVARAGSVHATPDDDVFISNRFGENTDIFSGSTFVDRVPIATTAFAASSNRIHFLSGPDRVLRAVDFTTVGRTAELYATQLPTTDGTVNFINAMAFAGNTLYVAAGDIGIVKLDDATAITRPFPQVSYNDRGGTTSVRASGDKAWFLNFGGRLTQLRIDPAGVALIEEREWAVEVGSVVRDFRDNGLLTTNGAKATVWSLVSAIPAQATNVTFAAPIENAVISNAHLVALLADGTVWTAPNGLTTPTKLNVPAMTMLSRAGAAIVLAEVQEENEKTVLHYYPAGDFATTPQRFTIDGVAAGSIALDATRAAIFTFNGITVIDLASGNVRVIPNSNAIIPRQMAFSGDDLLVIDFRRLLVFDDARTPIRDHELPADAAGFDVASNIATIATQRGMTALRYADALPQASVPFANHFYRQFAAGGDRVYLYDNVNIDVISTVLPQRLQHIATIPAAGTIDLTANDNGLFTFAANGTVTAYSRAGEVIAQTDLSPGFDSQPVAIRTVSNAVWASIGHGCTAQGCLTWTTNVLDPNTLAITSQMDAILIDVTVSGTRAYAVFSIPELIRVLNIADPLHPTPIAVTQAPTLPSAIAYSSGKVYVLAGKVFGYDESTLTKIEEHLTGGHTAARHQMRIHGTCAIIRRDTNPPVLYDLPSWTPSATQFTMPSPLRSFLLDSPMLLFLTDHSLELMYPATPPSKPRRRAAR